MLNGRAGPDYPRQALIMDTPQGLIVIMGCVNPNDYDMAQKAHTYLGKNIYLLLGGFHLGVIYTDVLRVRSQVL